MGFRVQGPGTQGQNYYRERYRDRGSGKVGDWRYKDDYKEKRDRYITPSSRDMKLRMKVMLTKLVK